jgi:hypothetical protein
VSRNGSGRSSVASTTLKIAVLAPMARAKVAITVMVNARCFHRLRVAKRKSLRRDSMVGGG